MMTPEQKWIDRFVKMGVHQTKFPINFARETIKVT